MKERPVNCEGTVVAHDQASEVPQPRVGALDDPAPFVPPKRAAILRCRPNAISLVRTDQCDPALPQPLSQWIAIVRFVSDYPHRLLPWPTGVMTPPYPDRRPRRFREPDFRRGCGVKVLSQRKTADVDHHHPLRPLAPLGFSDSAAPFFAGAKLPSRNDSLHFNCWHSCNSLKNARQTFSQMPCSSPSRKSSQQVEGCGYSYGKSRQRAPLRIIQRIPSSTRRFSIHRQPSRRSLRGFRSKSAIFFHCASVSNGPDRASGPPSALLSLPIAHLRKLSYLHFTDLY